MTSDPAGRRVRVTGARTGLRTGRRSIRREIDDQTQLGDLYIRSLMRAQLRLAAGVAVLLGGTVGMLPAMFVLVPSSRSLQLLGVPLPWLLLGLVVYPVVIGLGLVYVRRAERNEERFSDLVERPGPESRGGSWTP